MSTYALALRWARCPDGAELTPHPWVNGTKVFSPNKRELRRSRDKSVLIPTDGVREKPSLRYRSERREEYRRRLEAPDDLIVTAFLNAAPTLSRKDSTGQWFDCEQLLEFVNQYGLLGVALLEIGRVTGKDQLEALIKQEGTKIESETILDFSRDDGTSSLEVVTGVQDYLQEVWDAYAQGNAKLAATKHDMLDAAVCGLTPNISVRPGVPSLTLQTTTLYGFMCMETALVITGGTQITRCENCGNIFATGSGTGRRNTAKFCSNRCRVAAQRSNANHKGGPR